MKGTCPECGERTTFSRVDELEDEDIIKEGIEMLNSLTGELRTP